MHSVKFFGQQWNVEENDQIEKGIEGVIESIIGIVTSEDKENRDKRGSYV